MNPWTLVSVPVLSMLAWAGPSTIQDQGDASVVAGEQVAEGEDEIIELFRKVEHNLMRIERYLQRAGAGDLEQLKKVGESGLDELLKPGSEGSSESAGALLSKTLNATRTRGEQVLEDIDRILELAQKNGGSCSKPGSSQSQGQGQQQSETSRMQGNQAPQQEGGEKKKEPGSENQQEPAGDPRGNQESQDEPSSGSAKSMPAQATADPLQAANDAERWGELPIYARDLFRAEGGRELPPQYRDWIDAYHRRLNQRAGGR